MVNFMVNLKLNVDSNFVIIYKQSLDNTLGQYKEFVIEKTQ